MANSSLSRQIKQLGTPRRSAIILLGFALFALILFLEYTHSTKHGDLIGSIIYAIPFPALLTASLLSLTANRNEMLQTHISWQREHYILVALLFLSMAIICLAILVNSFMNNNLPDAVGLPIGGVGFLLMLFVFLRLIMMRRSKTGIK